MKIPFSLCIHSFFPSVRALLFWTLVLSFGLCEEVGAVQGDNSFYMEGTVVRHVFDLNNGQETYQSEPRLFSLRLCERQWMACLYADTNAIGGISKISCDGTNIYILIPNVPGKLREEHYEHVGSVYPGTIKLFRSNLLPIWWGFCSAYVTGNTNGPIVDFAGVMDEQEQPQTRLQLRVSEGKRARDYLGPVEAQIFPTNDDPAPIAEIQPLATSDINGLTVVTNYVVKTYFRRASPDGKRALMEKYIVAVNRIAVETNIASFVPEISKIAYIQDFRRPNSGSYLANHWLNADERSKVRKDPVYPTIQKNPASSGRQYQLLRGVILAIILVAAVGFFFFRQPGNAK